MVSHPCNPAFGRLTQQDRDFEARSQIYGLRGEILSQTTNGILGTVVYTKLQVQSPALRTHTHTRTQWRGAGVREGDSYLNHDSSGVL
jgi:hypothetical protein